MTDGSSPDPSWPRRGVRWSVVAALGCVLLSCGDPPPARDLPEFEARLERLRVELRVPGFSAGIVKDQRLVWARGFGLSDVEAGQPAAAGTSYHLASVTKTFASTVLLHFVALHQGARAAARLHHPREQRRSERLVSARSGRSHELALRPRVRAGVRARQGAAARVLASQFAAGMSAARESSNLSGFWSKTIPVWHRSHSWLSFFFFPDASVASRLSWQRKQPTVSGPSDWCPIFER